MLKETFIFLISKDINIFILFRNETRRVQINNLPCMVSQTLIIPIAELSRFLRSLGRPTTFILMPRPTLSQLYRSHAAGLFLLVA